MSVQAAIWYSLGFVGNVREDDEANLGAGSVYSRMIIGVTGDESGIPTRGPPSAEYSDTRASMALVISVEHTDPQTIHNRIQGYISSINRLRTDNLGRIYEA
jgi:hypothetical protein